jgi:acetyl esterase/lipase
MEQHQTTAGQLLPDAAAALAQFPEFVFTADTLETMRTLLSEMAEPAPGIDRSDHVVDDGPVIVTLYRPTGISGPLPTLYWMHGGGYIIGNRDLDAAELQRWCQLFSCACATVEYRLAPEHPFPTPLEDCYSGLCWLTDHADELEIDVKRLGIGGRSAGGGLAAALALLVRARGGPRVRFQFLDSPMLDDRRDSPSSQTPDLPVWSREANEFAWRSYLGERFGGDDVPAFASPARATDLSALPRCFISVGTIDVLRDEAIGYATRLNQAGVPTELHVYPGLPHGAVALMSIPATQRVVRDMTDYLARVLAHTTETC